MKTIGIDIGTTSITVLLFDNVKKEIIEVRTIDNSFHIESVHPFIRTQDADAIADQCIELFEQIRSIHPDIKSIGISGQMHGIVYVDHSGQAVSPLYSWQDESGNDVVNDSNMNTIQKIEEVTGIKSAAGQGIVTYLVHKTNKKYVDCLPKLANKIVTIGDYVGLRLTGRHNPVIHISNAQSLGLYDSSNNQFQYEAIQALGGDLSILPEVSDQFEIVGNYKNIPVIIAIGDNQAAFFGSVQNEEHAMLINIGTGSQIAIKTVQAILIDGIETRPYDQESYLLVGAPLSGGRSYRLLAQFFEQIAKELDTSINGYEFMEQLASREDLYNAGNKRNSSSINVITTFQGTRVDPTKTGSILNITESNFTPGALVNGFLEGMVNELYNFYSLISTATSIQPTKIIGAGNAIAKNKRLIRIIERKFGMPLQLSENSEEAACGAAIRAYEACSK